MHVQAAGIAPLGQAIHDLALAGAFDPRDEDDNRALPIANGELSRQQSRAQFRFEGAEGLLAQSLADFRGLEDAGVVVTQSSAWAR